MANETYDETIEKRQADSKAKFLDTLRETPVIEVACKRSGIGRTTYYRWCREDSAFAQASGEAFKQGVDFICDMSETQAIQLVKEKKLPAIIFYLRNNSARYGARAASRTQPAQISEPTAKEERLIKHALALSSGGKNTYAKKHKSKKVA